MADIRKAIYTLLTQDAGVSALIGTKVYPLRAPQVQTAPYITWHVINTLTYGTKANPDNNGESPVDRLTVQINCVAGNYTTASDIAAAVRTAIDRYPDTQIFGIDINGIDFNDESDTYDDEVNLYMTIVEYFIRRKN